MLIRPSGGVFYHLKALRRRALWEPFTDEIAQWLADWRAPRESLILIGPSGGYTLPNGFLSSFDDVQAYDLDPLASWLFARNHSPIEFHREDLFFREGRVSLKPIEEILLRHPRATIMFCNVLGQVPLEGKVKEAEWTHFLGELRLRLEGRAWASYHDLMTIEPLPYLLHAPVLEGFRQDGDIRKIPEIIASRGSRSKSDIKMLGNVEVIDHLTGGSWTAGLDKKYFGWSLTAKSLHIIEGVKNLPG